MTSIVLAGGKSLRLGRDKLSEKVGGESLIQHVLSRLRSISDRVLIVTAQDQNIPPFQPDNRIQVVSDLYPGKGSLGGIYTGLSFADRFACFVTAADMPFLNIALIQYLMRFSSDFDVVIPKVQGKVEPLHAVYSRNCLAPIKRLIDSDDLKIIDFFDEVKVRYIKEDEIDGFDPEHISFFNVNTQVDLERARKLIGQGYN